MKPAWNNNDRQKRLRQASRPDQRYPFERDRDRVLYSSAFHRLAGITQVAKAGEQDVLHTRQQHSYKVAQVGRRLAQKCQRDHPKLAEHLGLHEEVVEAACLAHDLGHPPFGHVGEECLDQLMGGGRGGNDGFEGNAQSFRVLVRLGLKFPDTEGLNLSRATLAACLKYPWLRDCSDERRRRKWSAYRSEKAELEWAREFHQHEYQTAEAHLMDWADDIAYSVHDIEDFHRCGVIPWHEIANEKAKQRAMVERAVKSWLNAPGDAEERLSKAMDELLEMLRDSFEDVIGTPYRGSEHQRLALRTLTSELIGRYVQATELSESTPTGVQISDFEQDQVRILKQITRDYVIETPALAAQQQGFRRVIKFLFRVVAREMRATGKVPEFLPHRLKYLWSLSGDDPRRFAADCIASLTEREALSLHARLSGSASGSLLDPSCAEPRPPLAGSQPSRRRRHPTLAAVKVVLAPSPRRQREALTSASALRTELTQLMADALGTVSMPPRAAGRPPPAGWLAPAEPDHALSRAACSFREPALAAVPPIPSPSPGSSRPPEPP